MEGGISPGRRSQRLRLRVARTIESPGRNSAYGRAHCAGKVLVHGRGSGGQGPAFRRALNLRIGSGSLRWRAPLTLGSLGSP